MLQETDINSSRHGSTGRVSLSLSGVERLHQRIGMVRRDLSLPFRLRRSTDALLLPPATAPIVSVPRRPGPARRDRRGVRPPLSSVPAQTQIGPADETEEPFIGHRYHRGERSDLLTQRQFCAVH